MFRYDNCSELIDFVGVTKLVFQLRKLLPSGKSKGRKRSSVDNSNLSVRAEIAEFNLSISTGKTQVFLVSTVSVVLVKDFMRLISSREEC